MANVLTLPSSHQQRVTPWMATWMYTWIHARMDIPAAQTLGLRLAAESGALTQSVYDFGITRKDASLPLVREETLYTYNKLPSQPEGKARFFPSPWGSW